MDADKVLIVDDHPLIQDALSAVVRLVAPGCEVIVTDTYAEALSRVEADASFRLVLLDLLLPDAYGLSGLATLRELLPDARIVLISGREEDGVIRSARAFGADGFLGKSAGMSAFVERLHRVLWGEKVFPAVSEAMKGRDHTSQKLAQLSPAQLRILMAVADGQLNKQIAYDLDIAEATVKSHLSSIFKKLGVSNRTQASLLARELLPRSEVSDSNAA